MKYKLTRNRIICEMSEWSDLELSNKTWNRTKDLLLAPAEEPKEVKTPTIQEKDVAWRKMMFSSQMSTCPHGVIKKNLGFGAYSWSCEECRKPTPDPKECGKIRIMETRNSKDCKHNILTCNDCGSVIIFKDERKKFNLKKFIKLANQINKAE